MKLYCYPCSAVREVPFGTRERLPCPECGTPLSAPPRERKPIERRSRPKQRGPISEASSAQREKVKGRACIRCRRGPCDPHHIVPHCCDHPDAVVPLCRLCHRSLHDGEFELLPLLEPHYREEQQHAVGHLGIARAYRHLAPSTYQAEHAA